MIDYADIMADEGKDERASVNKRWKYLRGLADKHKCLIVTATQANSSSFDFEDLTLRAFSEDRRKLDHVTAFLPSISAGRKAAGHRCCGAEQRTSI